MARPAVPDDRAAVVATVVAAFEGDPAWSYLLGAHYSLLAPLFAGALFDQRVDGGTVWMTAEATSVALWDPPGGPDAAGLAASWARFHEAADDGTRARVDAYDASLAAVRPAGEFWYLGVLATRPDRVGRGGATRVLAPGLQRADEDGLDCCLETSTAGNRAFYRRRGFTDAADVQVPGGPPTWWLRRPSQAPRSRQRA